MEIQYVQGERGKRKYVPERLVHCPFCKKTKKSFWNPAVCNHNQDEEGTPVPLVYCVEVSDEGTQGTRQ